ncbi:DUF4186 family protein [Streptomyces olivochromogenes]|uniref:DUF4186 family protein n=1 Tax=Streptomyces olivochromogenes TaxID=1963 RepID=UPI001F2F6CC1|nr:DUF4186 family protein [Streptomyces olivochromogenes]MCF3134599.1 DUF4186 family protein [Streptomyces olivochromogenes]
MTPPPDPSPSGPAPDRAAGSPGRRLDEIARHPFRAKFRLRGRDRATTESTGPSALRRQAHDLIAERPTPAVPYQDGGQTPYRGHPVFEVAVICRWIECEVAGGEPAGRHR